MTIRATVRRLLLGLGLAACAAAPAHAQWGDVPFGQNQVQYRNFKWRVLETEHFLIHYYPEIAEAAVDGARMAERSYARLSRLLNHRFREKKPLVFFATRGDFGQNNITGDLGEGTGAVAEGLRHRALIPFTGDYKTFEHVLQHELTHVFQYDIFARGRAGQGLQTLANVRPPLWFMEGMPEYLYYGGRLPYLDMIMRDAAVNGRIPTIEMMTRAPQAFFPYTYGHALWHYIGERWGDEAIGEIMNAVPTLGIERAFRRELGLSLEELSDEWKEHLQSKYLPQIAERERPRRFSQPLLSEKRTGGAPFFVAPALSPDGNYIAYIGYGSFLRGEVFPDLWLADARTGKRLRRLVQTTTNSDFEELRLLYSQSAFSPDGRTLAFTAMKGGRDILYLVDVKSRRVTRDFRDLPLDGVTGPTWSPDGDRLAFSGNRGGITDLFVINRDGTGFRQLTQDRYGDLMPQWSPDGRTIAFTSDRGVETDFDVLRFSPLRIALYDVETGAVTVVPRQTGRSINPQWAPDGKSIAYVSNRSGIDNIFLYDLIQQEHYRLTNVPGGVSSLTEMSPALTWARGADRMAYVYFDAGDVSVWSISNPRQLKKQPWRDGPAVPVVAQAEPVAVEIETGAKGDDAALDRTSRRVSLYRSAGGLRASATLPPLRSAAAGGPVTVVAMADSADFALPDTATFRRYAYRTAFEPEYVAQPTIGYAQDNFGRGLFGGSTIVFGDLMGNSRLLFSGAINGRLQEAQLFGAYTFLGSRTQWQVGLTQSPLFLFLGNNVTPNADGFTFTQTQSLLRVVQRGVFATAFYPLNRFTRLEAGVQFFDLSQALLNFNAVVNPFGQLAAPLQPAEVQELGSRTFVAPQVGYVSDNTLMGYTGPISGRRWRLGASTNLGNVQYSALNADYRRYDPILFNWITFATRGAIEYRTGRDEALFPRYIGRPFFVRGYDRENAFATQCIPSVTGSAAGCSAQQLVGSRTAYANAELRFPVVRRLELGLLPIALPPLDGLVFADVGAAWSAGQTLSLRRPDNYDPVADRQRYFLGSYGVGLRLNLFGLALVRWDYAIPLADPQRRGYWVWTLGPSF